jgi:hypothetical protein
MNIKISCCVFLQLVFFTLLFSGCNHEPNAGGAASTDGIFIYSGQELLNGRNYEIVTGRVQQLLATGPSGHRIIWSTSNPNAVDVNDTGLIRAGVSPNVEAVITVVSTEDPSVRAQVSFKTKPLR